MSSPSTLILGGSGKVARQITRLLAGAPHNHTVHSIIRSQSQAQALQALGANPIVQSLETSSSSDLAATITSTKAQTVLWCAGAGGSGGPERTRAVDRDAAVKAMDACVEAGVKRFILISAIDVRDREKAPEPEWYNDADRERSNKMRGALGAYMVAKFEADRELVTGNERRGLEYTIVRPGGLSDDEGQGKVEAGKVHLSNSISREDVAAVVVQCIQDDGTKGLAFDVVGGETPIKDAVAKVAKERIDTFEGRY